MFEWHRLLIIFSHTLLAFCLRYKMRHGIILSFPYRTCALDWNTILRYQYTTSYTSPLIQTRNLWLCISKIPIRYKPHFSTVDFQPLTLPESILYSFLVSLYLKFYSRVASWKLLAYLTVPQVSWWFRDNWWGPGPFKRRTQLKFRILDQLGFRFGNTLSGDVNMYILIQDQHWIQLEWIFCLLMLNAY